MHHVLTITYSKPLDDVDKIRPEHAEWLGTQIAAGRLLLAGRNEHATGGVLVTGDISIADADELIASDPYTIAQVAEYSRAGFNVTFKAPGIP